MRLVFSPRSFVRACVCLIAGLACVTSIRGIWVFVGLICRRSRGCARVVILALFRAVRRRATGSARMAPAPFLFARVAARCAALACVRPGVCVPWRVCGSHPRAPRYVVLDAIESSHIKRKSTRTCAQLRAGGAEPLHRPRLHPRHRAVPRTHVVRARPLDGDSRAAHVPTVFAPVGRIRIRDSEALALVCALCTPLFRTRVGSVGAALSTCVSPCCVPKCPGVCVSACARSVSPCCVHKCPGVCVSACARILRMARYPSIWRALERRY